MVPGTRISLDILVAAFKRGESPDAIHEDYETVALADVYAIFSYYLRHRAEVESYLAEQARLGTELRERMEEIYPPQGLRARLLATMAGESGSRCDAAERSGSAGDPASRCR
ncbi:DUF433 domain-containing protein [Nocardioides hungaricus]